MTNTNSQNITHAEGVDERQRDINVEQKYSALVWRRYKRNKMAYVSLWLIMLLVTVAVFAPFFSPQNPVERNSSEIFMPPNSIHFFHDGEFSLRPFVYKKVTDFDPETFQPLFVEDTTKPLYLDFLVSSWEYKILGITFDTHLIGTQTGQSVFFIGTDGLGRDVFSRILHGLGSTLFLSVLVMSICVVIGTLVGVASGYYGGKTDVWTQRVVELFLAFPELPLFLSLIAIIPRDTDPSTTFYMLIGVLSCLKWAQLSREIRGKALSIRSMDYVKSAIAVGAKDSRIIINHIVPNVVSHIVVVATAMIPMFILLESFLSFLGVGVRPPMISLGLLLNSAKDYSILGSYPWMLTPVLFILVAVLIFNAAGDGLRDAIDPFQGK